MKVFRAYKAELDLTQEQREMCARCAGAARFVYNWGLAQNIEGQKRGEKYASNYTLSARINKVKATDFPWLMDLPSDVYREALNDLHLAFESFFRRVKGRKDGTFKGKPGYPKFRKRKMVAGSFTYTKKFKVFRDSIRLPKIGDVRFKEQSYVPHWLTHGVRYVDATIKQRAGHWFAIVHVEEDMPERRPVMQPVAGVDLGLLTLATVSDGTRIANPRAFSKAKKKLARLSREMNRRVSGGSNRIKSALKLSRAYYRAANIRQDVLHKATTMLAKTKSVIVLEDLGVTNMLRHPYLKESVSEAGFGAFRRMLEYKTRWYGSRLVLANRFYPSSKTCNACGHVIKRLTLARREWTCPECGVHHDRDLNAALNLVRWWSTASSAGSNACGEERFMPVDRDQQVLLDEAGTEPTSTIGVSENG